ncbi:MAG: formate dehydrogenase subunit gamma [Oxalobacteraceae bacterium]|jgi:formate dehydrogenase subunit gamma|nr:formate dehydrogenase subunit gamma [Oxalobacteraceae bacterium]
MSDTVSTDAIDEILARFADTEGALLPILHAVQAVEGYVPADAIPRIAESLNLSRAEVHGVVSYYHHFRQKPAGKVVVQICRAEACQAVGADEFAQEAVKLLGCDFHESTQDGAVTLEPVYCLGQCACGPSIMINDDIHLRMTTERLKLLVDKARSQA